MEWIKMPDELFSGVRLHKRRTELQLTLRDLAEKTNLTASFLSQLERGLTNPSLKSLQRISDALNVPMLFFMPEKPNLSPVVRADDRSKLDLDDARVLYELLTPDLTGSLEVLIGTITGDCQNIARKLPVETEEVIFVLEGKLLVGLNDKDYQLNTGDSIRFNGSELVSLSCAGSGKTRWLSVITPPVL
jgi:transcriptional regulator with XRE-family HTH domain